MNFLPILPGFSGIDQNPVGLSKEVPKSFAHTWKTLHQMSWSFRQLILLIKNMVSDFFALFIWQDSKPTDLSKNSSVLSSTPASKQQGAKQHVKRPREASGLQYFNCPEFDKPEDNWNCPLSNKEEDGVEGNDFFMEMKMDPPPLDRKISCLKEAIAEEEITEEVGAESDEFKSDALGVLKSIENTQRFLQEISTKKPASLQDYLNLTESLQKKFNDINDYVSVFENSFPETRQLIKKTLKELEDKTGELEKELCVEVKHRYKPNPLIRGDGNCLFASIVDLLKDKIGKQHCRKLAARFIRNHQQRFESDVNDTMQSNEEAKSKRAEYEKLQGGKKLWSEKLEKKLGRKPTKVDFYCDCLESPTLGFWGGTTEITALSEELRVPILVFTLQDTTTWRLDLAKGLSKFRDDNSVLLLYYEGINGINHYQSLNPK